MGTITIPEEKFHKVLTDVETLIADVTALFDQDEIARQRLAQIKEAPSIGKSEKDLDAYLKRRGVKVG